MQNNDKLVYRSLLLLAAIIGLTAGWQYYSGIKLEREAIEKQRVSVAAYEVIGDARDFRGRLNSPLRLLSMVIMSVLRAALQINRYWKP